MTAAYNSFFFNWEISLLEWLQAHLDRTVLQIVGLASVLGEELFLVMVLGFVYWCWDKKAGRTIGFAIVLSNILTPMVKNVFFRSRPYIESDSIKLLRPIEEGDIYDLELQGYSFPSGHSSNAATVFASIAIAFRKRIFVILAVVCPLLVGFSRMAVGAHFPTDILAGLLIGCLIAFAVPALERRIRSKALFYAILLVVTLPGFFYCRSSDYYTGMGLLIGMIAGVTFEEKCVRFENTRSVWRMIARMVGGGLIFLGLNTLLKLPFSSEFLNGGSEAALLVRCARYAIVSFVDIGVYPLVFRLTAGIGKKN